MEQSDLDRYLNPDRTLAEADKYPIIWKKEDCFRGDCKGDSIKHWWSIPFCATFGLVSECYHCNKFKTMKFKI